MAVAIAVGALAAAAAAGTCALLDPAIGGSIFAVFVLAILVSSALAGVRAGITTLVLSIPATLLLHAPRGVLTITWADDAGRQAVLLIAGGVAIALVGRMHATRRAAAETAALLDAAIETQPIGFAFVDRDMRYRRVNDAMAHINQQPAGEHLGRRISEVLPATGGSGVEALVRSVLTSGEPRPDVEIVAMPAEETGRRHLLASYFPVPGPGDAPVGVAAIVLDITARRRAELAARLLGDVGAALSASLELEPMLQRVAELVVRDLADACSIVVEEDRDHRRVARVARDPERERPHVDLGVERGGESGWERAVAGDVELGRQRRIDVDDETLQLMPVDRRQVDMLRRLRTRSMLATPLVIRGTVRGTIAMAAGERRPPFDDDDLALAEDIASRLALAIDSVQLYQRQRAIAQLLQRGLLPAAPPAIPGLDVAVRYVALGEETEIGGDFYDVVECRRGPLVVIGDVCGTGPSAAAVTALIRHTLHAVAAEEAMLSPLLVRVNSAIRAHAVDETFATLALARVPASRDRDGSITLRVANAGHPPPLVARAGEVRRVGPHGTLLGWFEDIETRECDVPLRAGDLLVLYTDGVIEARRGREVFGEHRLEQLVAEASPGGAEHVADRIEKAVRRFAGDPLTDDLALVVLGARDAPG